MKAKRLLFLVMAICLASGVKAQNNNSEALFYKHESVKLTDPQGGVLILRIINGKIYEYQQDRKVHDTSLRNVCRLLKQDSNYYEKRDCWHWWGDDYDSDMSNLKWIVYSKHWNAVPPYTDMAGNEMPGLPERTDYIAIKRDYSEYMIWTEPLWHDHNGDVNGELIKWKRITKDELKKLNFTAARDFLQ